MEVLPSSFLLKLDPCWERWNRTSCAAAHHLDSLIASCSTGRRSPAGVSGLLCFDLIASS